jgi:4-amino-4-deoxy-L-arabinose transferase-like glycosyltransferase
MADDAEESVKQPLRRSPIGLVAIAAALFLITFLLHVSIGGLYSVYEVSEAREGEVVNVIRETGEWVLPLRHKNIVPSKPPLFHWLSLLVPPGIMSPELALRFPSMAAGALLISITFLFAALRFGLIVGLIAAVVLSSSHGFISLASDGRVDMLFNLLLSWAIFAVIKDWFVDQRSVPRLVAPIAIGLSVLAKGPLTYAILGMVVLPAVLGRQSFKRLLGYFLNPRWALAIILPLLWYIAAAFKGGKHFIGRQLLFENMDRLVGAEGITAKPFYFYLKEFWLFAAPWSLLVPILLYVLIRSDRRWELRKVFSGGVVRALICWAVVPLIFFSLAVGKRSSYLLTVLPPISILLSLFVDRWMEVDNTGIGCRTFKWLAGLIIFFTVTPFLLYVSLIQFGGLIDLNVARNAVVAVQRHTVWPLILVGVGVALIALLGLYFGLVKGRKYAGIIGVALFVQLGTLVYPVAWQVYKGDQRTYRHFADQLRRWDQWSSTEVAFIKRTNDESFDGLFFYLKRAVPLFVPEKIGEDVLPPEKPGYYLARQEWINQQRDVWTVRVRPILKGGRAVDSSEEQVVLFELVASESA